MTEPEKIQIFDTTLRDGEQSPGIALSLEEKVTIGRQLARLGVDVIEAGFPVNSENEFNAVQAVAQQVEGPVITALARARKVDIDKAAGAVADAERPRIHTFVSTSDIHIEHQMRNSRRDVKGLARASVAQAKRYVDDVEFSPMDATRADWDFTAEVIQIAVDEGATVVNVPDTVGYTTPDEYRRYMEYLRREVKDAEHVTWSVHDHNDFGLAIANSWAGVQGGARQVEGTINGIGERAGNTDLAAFIMLVETRGHELGNISTNIDTRELGPTAELVSRYTGYSIPRTQPVVGQNAFAHESGIHQQGVLNNSSTFEIMDPEKVGWKAVPLPIGKHSGRAALVDHLEKQPGYDYDAVKKTLDLVNGFRDERGNVDSDQLTEIHEEAKRREAAPYDITHFDVSASEGMYSASVSLSGSDGAQHTAEVSSKDDKTEIDGSVAAIIGAIAKATDTNYSVEDVKHASIGKGKSAIDQATVEIRLNGKTVIGKGLSTDTNKAAGLGYIDALRKAHELNY